MAQQTRTIKGVVLDEQAEAIIGASVSVTGTSIGGATDVNGLFSLNNVPATSKTLQISYLGYETQTVDITGKTEINVRLVPSDSELDEVVIVGYGVQKKAHLTGSIATVVPADIADLSVTSLSSALSGLMPGVSVSSSSNRPGEPSRITIRGNTTPVYVIDDIVSTEDAFNNLDASMIENISVLKDGSAAIYGASSAVGVVLVKTKRGHIGKPKISYNGQFGYTDEFYRSKMLDSYNLGVIYNGVRAADLSETHDARKDFFQADELAAMQNLNIDLLDKYWSPGLTQKHSVNVSGGNEHATYFAGLSYVTQDGNLGNIDYDRWNYSAGVDAKISKYLKASLKVSGDYGSKQKAYNKVGGESDEKDYLTLLTRPRYMPETVTNPITGEILPVGMYGITNGAGDQTQNYNYTLVQNLGNYTKNMPQNMTVNGSVEYEFGWSEFLKGLKFKFNYAKTIGTTKDNQYGSDYTLYKFPDGNRGGSGSHLFVDTQGYPMNFDVMTTVPVSNGGFLRRNVSRADSYQMNFYATYARKFGLHDVSALFTIEKSESESEYVWGMVMQPYSFTNHQSNGASGDQTTEFKRSEAGKLSYVGRLNYNYAGKYLAEYLVRSDASTKFAPENYWGTFHSFSAGWIVSEENWFKENVSFMDFFKIRGSFGLLGRDNIAAWAWLMTYGNEAVKGPIFGNNPDQNAGAHFQMPGTVPNRNAHWDKSYKSNFGLDLNFLKNRLTVNLDGYYEWNRDEFLSVGSAPNYPTTIGAPPSSYNYGATDRYGVELSLGWHDKIGKDFKYHVKLNTGLSDNKVITYPWQAAATRALDAVQPNERSDRGLWGYECIGMFRSNQEIAEYFAVNNLSTYMGKTQDKIYPGMLIYRDVRGSQKEDGSYYAPGDPNDPKGNLVDSNDRIQISKRSGNPYGFTLNFGGEYKSLSFSAQLGASWGSYTMMPNAAISTNTTTLQFTSLPSFWADNMFIYQDVLDDNGQVVAPQNLEAKYPNLRFSDNSIASTFWKISNTNVLLRNFTVAYSLPKAWVKYAGVEGCRLNLTGQNLLSFYNPYPDKFTNPMVSYNTYPTLRKFTLGLSVTF
ncbi:SusC/RagA family TonB-linked outer membrane protein [Bacteroidia bacterium]|nr:SusC/RagA family TonB-linked outer membrane protein [Bacteroidia bacterium]